MRSDRARALEALHRLDPGCDRVTWHKIGRAAIAAGLTVDELDAWSATAGNYKGHQDVQAAFKTIKPEGATGAGTLFHLARAAGWTDRHTGPESQGPATTLTPPAASRNAAPGRGAADVWTRCESATSAHPYLVEKGAAGVPLGALRVVHAGDVLTIQGERMAGALVVPVTCMDRGSTNSSSTFSTIARTWSFSTRSCRPTRVKPRCR